MSGPVLTLNNGREIPVSEDFVADAIQQAANTDNDGEDALGEPQQSKTHQAGETSQGDANVANDTNPEPEQQADTDDGAEGVAIENSRRLDNVEEAIAEIRNAVTQQTDEEQMHDDDEDHDEGEEDEESDVHVNVEEAGDMRDDAAEIADALNVSTGEVLDVLEREFGDGDQANDDEDDEDEEMQDEEQTGDPVNQAQTPTPASPGSSQGQPANTGTVDDLRPPGVPEEAYDLGPNDPDDLEKVVQAGSKGEQWATEELLRQAIGSDGGR